MQPEPKFKQDAAASEAQSHILQKVEADPAFREHLIADPKGVIEAETGLELPDEALVVVQEAIADAQQTMASADAPLTDDELNQVLGGMYGCGDGVVEGDDLWRCRIGDP